MNKIALLIPCLIVLSGCNKTEEAAPPAAPAPVVSAVPAETRAPVAVSEPVKQEAAGETAAQAQPVAKSEAPAAPEVPTPKAEAVAPAAEAKPQASVSETEAFALAKKKNCFSCHQVERKVLGPSWKDISAKYRGDATAQARLENVIAKGGKGVWGNLAMPPQPQLSEAERKLLVRYILNLK